MSSTIGRAKTHSNPSMQRHRVVTLLVKPKTNSSYLNSRLKRRPRSKSTRRVAFERRSARVLGPLQVRMSNRVAEEGVKAPNLTVKRELDVERIMLITTLLRKSTPHPTRDGLLTRHKVLPPKHKSQPPTKKTPKNPQHQAFYKTYQPLRTSQPFVKPASRRLHPPGYARPKTKHATLADYQIVAAPYAPSAGSRVTTGRRSVSAWAASRRSKGSRCAFPANFR